MILRFLKLTIWNLFTNKNTLIKVVKREDMGLIAAKHVVIAKTMISAELYQENATNQDALKRIFTHRYVKVSVILLIYTAKIKHVLEYIWKSFTYNDNLLNIICYLGRGCKIQKMQNVKDGVTWTRVVKTDKFLIKLIWIYILFKV